MGQATATLCKASELLETTGPPVGARWERAALNGLLTELVGGPRSANVSAASRLILQAQAAVRGEPEPDGVLVYVMVVLRSNTFSLLASTFFDWFASTLLLFFLDPNHLKCYNELIN